MWRSKRYYAMTDYERKTKTTLYGETDDVPPFPPRRRDRKSLFSVSMTIDDASMLEETDRQSDLYTNDVPSQRSRLRPVASA